MGRQPCLSRPDPPVHPVREVLRSAATRLAAAGVPEPALDASVLLAHALGTSREALLLEPLRPVPADLEEAFEASIRRRCRFEPVAYLCGHKEFYGLEMVLDAHVLVPRPDSECLVEAALAALPEDAHATVVDVGTGSGCLAAVLGAHRPGCRVVALDLSREALAVARRNVRGAALVQADLTAPLAAGSVDLLLSNPPYLDPAGRDRAPPDLAHEPALALWDPGDGTATLARLVADAPRVLAPGGWLLVEHGHDQGERARQLARDAGLEQVTTGRDLAGRERFLSARRAGAAGGTS